MVRYEHRSYQHYESVEFRDGRAWRVGDAARTRLEHCHSRCRVSAALRANDAHSARLNFLELLGFAPGIALDVL